MNSLNFGAVINYSTRLVDYSDSAVLLRGNSTKGNRIRSGPFFTIISSSPSSASNLETTTSSSLSLS